MKKYRKGIDELMQSSEKGYGKAHEESPAVSLRAEGMESSRRDFLKTFGFAVAGTALASCEQPVTKAIPYLVKQDRITPGKSTYFASSFYDGEIYQSLLVKVRDGRPIKIEGNEMSSLSNGSTSGLIQGTVLELYDENRYRGPMASGEKTSWEEADARIRELLDSADGKVVLLSGGIISPTTREVINGFMNAYPNVEHVVYDPVSSAAIREANRRAFGRGIIPDYRFDRADMVLGVGADFLGTWISPVEYASRYAANRKPSGEKPFVSRHLQIESGMSLTGMNADKRFAVKPSRQKAVLVHLLADLMERSGIDPGSGSLHVSPVDTAPIADELMQHKQKALVVCGSNDPETQLLVTGINSLLGSYGHTIDFSRPLHTLQGDDQRMESLVREMNGGEVSGIIFYHTNPAFDYHDPDRFRSGMAKLDFSVSLNYARDETSEVCDLVCPDHHYLESWNDAMPKDGIYSLAQPAIHPIFDTRQAQESLMKWSTRRLEGPRETDPDGGTEGSFYDAVRRHWEDRIHALDNRNEAFPLFWNRCLHDGVFEIPADAPDIPEMDLALVRQIMLGAPADEDGGLELELYVPVNTGTGKHSNNPWLQETPDPVTKVTWDNFAAISPVYAEENGLETGDVIRINGSVEIPVIVQPGQQPETISIALGYGKDTGGKAAVGVGKNLYPLVRVENGYRQYAAPVTIGKTAGRHELAITQNHHSMEGRPHIRETTLEAWKKDPASGNELHEKIQHHLDSLYEGHEFPGHHWGMTVDLSSCTGCNACVVACTAENNVPVVGQDLVKQAKEMHWIRIDRYYSGDPADPEVLLQPVMCQHCDQAPCENVCPVSATVQSAEGINQQIYNRCIGTRYCNNNCPYKVRRFNWFDFTKADALPKNTSDPAELTLDLPRMVLNPDVTIRAKGVMEKCSFCIQRIQEKKLAAKLENRPLEDGEIRTACQQVCPAQAITFGDLNDENSEVSRQLKNPRNYHLLEELHTLPTVSYLTNVRHKSEEI